MEGRTEGGRLKSAICLIGLGRGGRTNNGGWPHSALNAYAEETNRSLGTSDLPPLSIPRSSSDNESAVLPQVINDMI